MRSGDNWGVAKR